MSLRVGGWLGALALVTLWWYASLADPPTARERAEPSAKPSTTNARVTSAFSERLKQGLASAPGPPAPRRNPFLFGTREPEPPPIAEAPPVAPPPVAVVASPDFTLAGIATSDTPDGLERTAVMSGTKGVLLVKAGDELPTGLRVVRVEEDHVVLADAVGTETILRLK